MAKPARCARKYGGLKNQIAFRLLEFAGKLLQFLAIMSVLAFIATLWMTALGAFE